ncbi:helix-turn-helix domain-containing protein [Streptomyces sp. TRM68367]|uniref:helix-turn-helix domain-containing protein n=1 Tax=Streptomyces sp. TRM68367 TaxID=2758415 RepID=UPI00165C8570|nr:helix-turn-helix domain-containing protein [Streptomyces sp. TRM68367]MBC9724646.1 helix-turn-helix domain-containing protein [Streptomyces sp. TRM68367]
MVSEEHRRVLDPEQDTAALKALTHPLRIQLLGLLRLDGPATASELAARTGESSASTSYHLRVLAKYAFIAEAEHRDSRERRWRALHAVTAWSNAAMESSAAGRAFVGLARRRQIEHLEESVARYEADVADGRLGQEWLESSGIGDSMTRLTPHSLAELRESYDRKLEELAARDADDPRAAQIMLITARLPVAPRVPDPDPGTGKPSADEPDTPADPEPGPPAAAGPETPDTPTAPENLS